MATGTFTYNALRTKTPKEHIKTQRKIVRHSNSTRAMTAIKPYLSIAVGLVWFARYRGKMYSRHLFSYGGLAREIQLTDWSTAGNLFNQPSGVKLYSF